ncbi:MAG: replicative DNA helicase [Candidatus Marinimicrobia bacterium]|nr:replicative DNA helicase [Candidatus Neomarinimicrobiota bacterium]|tara:strand:- start:8597 stop:9952 length:1356 start_codon:yes stop_codon:yes gene_type:complete
MSDVDKNIKISPHSEEAELAVLGCMLINDEAANKVIQILSANDFYIKKNKIIYNSILEVFNSNKNIDHVSVVEQLKKNKELKNVGGAYYVTGLTESAPSAHNVDYYSNIVKDKSILRNIVKVAQNMTDEVYENQDEVNQILDKAEQTLFNLSQDSEKNKFQKLNPILTEVLDSWGNRKTGALTGVGSGFHDLDNLLTGFQKSDLIILAGRPSMGKTALALNFARNAALNSKCKIGFFSLEMSSKQLVERLLTSEAKVDSHAVRTGKLPKHDWPKLSDAASALSDSGIYIDDSADLNIMELRAKARHLKSEHDIDILFIDYIQLLNASTRMESRQQEISFISRSLKALAKELDVPIVSLSQLSRAVESRTDHRPIMSDLRESGAIEQDADVVLFIYRKHVYSKEEEDRGLGEIIIAKHRNGPTGIVKVSFVDKYARFNNLESIHSEYPSLPT